MYVKYFGYFVSINKRMDWYMIYCYDFVFYDLINLRKDLL